MLKVLVIAVAVLIAVVNVSAMSEPAGKRNVHRKPDVVRVGAPSTYLKEGLTTEEVVRLLGEPTRVSELGEEELRVARYEFQRGRNRVFIAEFVNGALVSSRTETREQLVHASLN